MVIKKKDKEAQDEYFPFDDELQYKFYRDLPDLSRFIVDASATASNDSDLEEMQKKILKSQSKDQIDERAQEFLKQNCH